MTSETARGRATRTMPATAFEMLLPRPVWVVVAVGMAALSLFVSGAAVESVVGGSGWGAAGTAVAIAGGFAPRADKHEAKLTRQQLRMEVPLNYPVRPGDTIVVRERWF